MTPSGEDLESDYNMFSYSFHGNAGGVAVGMMRVGKDLCRKVVGRWTHVMAGVVHLAV